MRPLRIFEDDQGKMNLSLLDVWRRGDQLFHIHPLCRHQPGQTTSFIYAAKPEVQPLVEVFADQLPTGRRDAARRFRRAYAG